MNEPEIHVRLRTMGYDRSPKEIRRPVFCGMGNSLLQKYESEEEEKRLYNGLSCFLDLCICGNDDE